MMVKYRTYVKDRVTFNNLCNDFYLLFFLAPSWVFEEVSFLEMQSFYCFRYCLAVSHKAVHDIVKMFIT